MMNQYTLGENHEPIRCDDIREWGRFMEKADRHVGNDMIGGVHVSTVFLGTDHRFMSAGPPILFETMIFGGEHDEYQIRYETWDQAEKGHEAAKKLVAEGIAAEEELKLEGYPETVKEIKKATEEDCQDVDPYVYIHFVRENKLRNAEVIVPVQYPGELTAIIEIQNYGFKWADENPMPGWVVKIVKVRVNPRIPRELLR